VHSVRWPGLADTLIDGFRIQNAGGDAFSPLCVPEVKRL
jgi:hypothetical protein